MTRRSYFRIRFVSDDLQKAEAVEYLSEKYVSSRLHLPAGNVTWRSGPQLVDDLIELLLGRGRHQTDIGDALDEAWRVARKHNE